MSQCDSEPSGGGSARPSRLVPLRPATGSVRSICSDALGPDGDTAAGLELRARPPTAAAGSRPRSRRGRTCTRCSSSEGDGAEAARAAAMTAMYLMMDTGLMAPVRGWLRRAERLAEGHDDTPAHALIAMTRTYERFMCGDMEAAASNAIRAIELGERLGVPPAVVIGRVASARVEIYAGEVREGLEQLGEIGALLMSGEVDPLTTGMMYCELICAAQGLGRYDLASEWTEVMEHWRHGAAFGGINGRCRVHRAEMLRISGPCDAAEAEALGACDELRPWMRREFGGRSWSSAPSACARATWPAPRRRSSRRTPRLDTAPGAGARAVGAGRRRRCRRPHPPRHRPSLRHPVEGTTAVRRPAAGAPARRAGRDRRGRRRRRHRPTGGRGAPCDRRHLGQPLARRVRRTRRARVALLDGDLERAIDDGTPAVACWTEMGAPFEAAVARVVLRRRPPPRRQREPARLEWKAARAGVPGVRRGDVGGTGRAAADRRATALPPRRRRRPPPRRRRSVVAATPARSASRRAPCGCAT